MSAIEIYQQLKALSLIDPMMSVMAIFHQC
jgi:hypothetical protein